MQATTVREALRASLAGTFGTVLSVVPRLIVFMIALGVGWAISSLLARATVAALRAMRFDEMAGRSGLAGFVEKMGVHQDPSGAVASAAKWVVRLLTLVVALDVLGLPAGSGVLHQLLLWLPNLVVGLVALVIGGLAATALSRLVQGLAAGAGLPNPRVLATATSVAVWAFAIVVAVSQLGVATSMVNLALVGVVGAIALATGLAFGWAARERAAQLLTALEDWHAVPSSAAATAKPSVPSAEPDLGAPSSSAASTDIAGRPELERLTPELGLSASEAHVSAPGLEVSAPELEVSTPGLGASASALDDRAPCLDPAAPALESAAPEFEAFLAEYDVPAPEFDAPAQAFEAPLRRPAAPPEFDAPMPELGTARSEGEAVAPEFAASASELAKSAAQPELDLADERTFAPAALVPFEESWLPRSGLDRRRIPRPGPDRRATFP
jgi:mechanosensitive ion channel-like protein